MRHWRCLFGHDYLEPWKSKAMVKMAEVRSTAAEEDETQAGPPAWLTLFSSRCSRCGHTAYSLALVLPDKKTRVARVVRITTGQDHEVRG